MKIDADFGLTECHDGLSPIIFCSNILRDKQLADHVVRDFQVETFSLIRN